ncbi:unnamed protein product [Gulo gulo]|uniref:Uncharacterized protein n=1 Tax=Gulo gulo TaxID=48420 RepID=A0A9X9M0L7_GULGU|nr:unnamed protein product [Gulo gulo]
MVNLHMLKDNTQILLTGKIWDTMLCTAIVGGPKYSHSVMDHTTKRLETMWDL